MDFKGDERSSIVDADSTMVSGENLVKVNWPTTNGPRAHRPGGQVDRPWSFAVAMNKKTVRDVDVQGKRLPAGRSQRAARRRPHHR